MSCTAQCMGRQIQLALPLNPLRLRSYECLLHCVNMWRDISSAARILTNTRYFYLTMHLKRVCDTTFSIATGIWGDSVFCYIFSQVQVGLFTAFVAPNTGFRLDIQINICV